jgi:hypothetical protein
MSANTIITDKLSIIKEYEELGEQFFNKIRELRLELKSICDGTCGNYKKIEFNIPATYLDSGYTKCFMLCKICSKSENLPNEPWNF